MGSRLGDFARTIFVWEPLTQVHCPGLGSERAHLRKHRRTETLQTWIS